MQAKHEDAAKANHQTTKDPFIMDAVETDIWQSESAHREAMTHIRKAFLNLFPQFHTKLVMVTVVRVGALDSCFYFLFLPFILPKHEL